MADSSRTRARGCGADQVRAPDAGGLANWTANLDAHLLSRSEVLLAFSESAEHQMLTADLTGSTSGHGIAFA